MKFNYTLVTPKVFKLRRIEQGVKSNWRTIDLTDSEYSIKEYIKERCDEYWNNYEINIDYEYEEIHMSQVDYLRYQINNLQSQIELKQREIKEIQVKIDDLTFQVSVLSSPYHTAQQKQIFEDNYEGDVI